MTRPRPETPFAEYSDDELDAFIEDVADGGSTLSGASLAALDENERGERVDALRRRVELLLEYNKRQLDNTGA